jgi:hypothetical protein
MTKRATDISLTQAHLAGPAARKAGRARQQPWRDRCVRLGTTKRLQLVEGDGLMAHLSGRQGGTLDRPMS